MKIIAGLGNPGSEYAKTKHNVGFMFVDALAEKLNIADEWKLKQDTLVAEGRIGTEKVLLVKPLTYMNESGRAIGPLLSWYKLAPSDLIVIHDDRLRIRCIPSVNGISQFSGGVLVVILCNAFVYCSNLYNKSVTILEGALTEIRKPSLYIWQWN